MAVILRFVILAALTLVISFLTPASEANALPDVRPPGMSMQEWAESSGLPQINHPKQQAISPQSAKNDKVPAMTELDQNWFNVLFMVASVALFVIAIGLTVLTLIVTLLGRGWVTSEIEKHSEKQSKITAARMAGFVGYICGRLRDSDPEFLDRAITFSREAYKALPEKERAKIAALNNLTFYLSLRADPADGKECIDLARILRSHYGETGNLEHLNTYASVVATYHNAFPDPQRELEEALEVMDAVLSNRMASKRHKKSAQGHKKNLEAIRKPKKVTTKKPKKVATRPKKVARKTKKRAGS